MGGVRRVSWEYSAGWSLDRRAKAWVQSRGYADKDEEQTGEIKLDPIGN